MNLVFSPPCAAEWYEFSIFAALRSRIGAGSIAGNCGIGDAQEKKIRKLSQ